MILKVFIILWKDLLMRKNHYVATTFEIIIPIGLIILGNIAIPKTENEMNNDPLSFEPFMINSCSVRHGYYEKILYEPSTPFTNELMSKAACYAGYRKSSVKPEKLDYTSNFTIGIKFNIPENFTKIPIVLNYTIYPVNQVWGHLHVLWRSSDYIPRYSIPFLHNVIEIQRAIDVSYMELQNVHAPKINFKNTNLFNDGPRIFLITLYLALFVAFSLMVPPIISRLIQEKYTGAKELMLIMGVKKWELWLAKFLDSFVFALLTVTGMVIFLYIPLKEDSNMLHISPLVLWALILYGLIGVITFLFFLSCFFEKPSFAVFVSEVIWCISFMFNYFFFHLVDVPFLKKVVMCFLPHVTLMNGVSVLLDYDFYDKDIKWTERILVNDNLSLLDITIVISFNILFYSILTWYLDEVKPGRFSIPKPYEFCFKKSFWTGAKVVSSKTDIFAANTSVLDDFESVPSNLRRGISIQNVTKVYKLCDKASLTAVDNVSINFYHGEISALLGHNGAGKTTIFSIITGLIPPTSGKVFINGYDLALNINEARQSLGLCPQKDMLFNDLTVLQILKFFGVIKGLSVEAALLEAHKLIKQLKLEHVRNTQALNLSGGQKRKVSLAIALIGGSEVLVLDEPTSGMDPEIRREIWEIILKFRGTRTILITTHFMEEADALCDRIAIMESGRIKCYGSSMFLKSKYGKGYVLSVVVKDAAQEKNLTNLIKRFVPSAKFKTQNVRTIFYELSESEVDNFPALFSNLESEKNDIISYSISVATLEDVFLRLRDKNNATENPDCTDSVPYQQLINLEDGSLKKVTGFSLFLYQFWALLFKKVILLIRKSKVFLLYCILPVLLIVSSTLFSDVGRPTNKVHDLSGRAPIPYSTGLYPRFSILYSNAENLSTVKSFPEFVQNLNNDVREVSSVTKEIYQIFKNDFHEYARKINLGVSFSSNETHVFHNDLAVHMVPVAINLMDNFVFKMHDKNNSIITSVDVQFVRENQFFRIRTVAKCHLKEIPDFSGSQTFFYFLAPLSEKIFGAKDIQLMIISPALYWLSHLLVDVFSFVLFIIIVVFWFSFLPNSDIWEYGDDMVGGLILWGVGMILLSYVISTVVKNEAKAFTTSIFIFIPFTFVFNELVTSKILPKFIIYLHPTSILKAGFSDLCGGFKGGYKLSLFLYDLFLFGILILKDSKLISKLFHWLANKLVKVDYGVEEDKDELVREEAHLVKNTIKSENTSGFALVAIDLKRWYLRTFKLSPAIRGISFTVKEGECFGLLGVNGAGKTSTFKILTGNIPPSSGMVLIRSGNLSCINNRKFLSQIGYCPQFGGFIPILRGREVLEFFGYLRGLHRSHVRFEVKKWMQKLELLDFAERKCGSYSGGNQRKLSTAVSLIGDCPLIFLDEPTSGVDPASRRTMWKSIDEIKKRGQSVVLTSHSMDECEALCSRLAIMVAGKFRCLGEITTLKNKFGQGYTVQLKISSDATEENLISLKTSFIETFDNKCALVDEHLTILQYRVPKEVISWADLFLKLKGIKNEFEILESYIASETTLEEIFIYLARNN